MGEQIRGLAVGVGAVLALGLAWGLMRVLSARHGLLAGWGAFALTLALAYAACAAVDRALFWRRARLRTRTFVEQMERCSRLDGMSVRFVARCQSCRRQGPLADQRLRFEYLILEGPLAHEVLSVTAEMPYTRVVPGDHVEVSGVLESWVAPRLSEHPDFAWLARVPHVGDLPILLADARVVFHDHLQHAWEGAEGVRWGG